MDRSLPIDFCLVLFLKLTFKLAQGCGKFEGCCNDPWWMPEDKHVQKHKSYEKKLNSFMNLLYKYFKHAV